MNNTESKKRLMLIVIDNYNGIYKASKKIAKEWDKQTIPLTTLRIMLDKIIVKDIDIPKDIKDKFNNLTDGIYTICKDRADQMNTKDISVSLIGDCVNIVTKSLRDIK